MLSDFKKFIFRGNVIDLAVGVIIGAAFNNVVTALVKDLLTPLIAAIGGQPDFSKLQFTIRGSTFMYGDFINALISFLIMGATVYFFVVLPLNKFSERLQKPPQDPTVKLCPECLSEIPVSARRCAHCTSPLQ